ncbi:MAG: hypothetical protein ACTS4X_01985, partial [Candidatus Hodgkinia cicadicola]
AFEAKTFELSEVLRKPKWRYSVNGLRRYGNGGIVPKDVIGISKFNKQRADVHRSGLTNETENGSFVNLQYQKV